MSWIAKSVFITHASIEFNANMNYERQSVAGCCTATAQHSTYGEGHARRDGRVAVAALQEHGGFTEILSL
jgi:hypothetical protein